LQTQLDTVLQEVLQELAKYGILNLELEEMPYLLERLRIRQASWIDKQDAKLKLEQALALLQTEIAKQEILLATRKEQLRRDLESFTEQENHAEKLRDSRGELYGSQNATAAEEKLDKELRAAEAVLENARKDLELAQRKQEQLNEWEKTLGKVTQDRALELKETEADFKERLRKLEFKHENDYMLAILSAAEQQVLAQEAEELRDRKKELQTRLFDRKAQHSLEKEKKLTDQPRKALEEKGRLVEQDLKITQDAIGVDKHILQSSSENRAQLQEQVQKIEIQKDELRRWEMLHNLIGSADGKKFRNFAQGLTFDIMIAHANRQLQKMSDRYLLQRHSRQALELNVIDNYQAGEIRSTANLSGGESFLVSLSLALGLSQMVSRKVSVDALFLDEGFGALDEDALDIALDTLAGLQRDGKLIGVISHVPALKERIATQIQVISKSGGRSILQGPGCSQLRSIK
ncbi:MAG: SbcC/MukB-like Walker B domain-containing protein, partial [Syntrophomonadaceae bacterium]|nr:SbcC/MukB-like Walker B domain-containing protein [Syntrophomonadaceae bacterium]